MAPVLDHDVDLAGAEALPRHLLVEVLVVDGAAELFGRDLPDHVSVGLVADPRVDRHVEIAAVFGRRVARSRTRVVDGVTATPAQRGRSRQRDDAHQGVCPSPLHLFLLPGPDRSLRLPELVQTTIRAARTVVLRPMCYRVDSFIPCLAAP